MIIFSFQNLSLLLHFVVPEYAPAHIPEDYFPTMVI